MASSSIVRLIFAAESSSLRLIFQKGIFKSSNRNGCGSKFGARMMNTVSVNSGDSAHSSSTTNLPSPRVSPPWLMLPPAFVGGDMVHNFYSLAQNKVVSFNMRSALKEKSTEELPDDDAKIVGSSHGWLALFNERNCNLFLSNPLTRRHIKLPPIHTLPIPQENLRGGYGCVSKVIISCSPDDEEEDCRAMMIFNTVDSLAFCCPGRSTEWTPIGALLRHNGSFHAARSYDDLVYSSREKLFFCLTDIDSHDLEGWDVGDPHSPRLHWLNEDRNYSYIRWFDQATETLELKTGLWCRPLRYLVFAEQSNQLFLVTRHLVEQMAPDGSAVEDLDNDIYPYKTIAFDVHKIDREEGGGKLSYMEGSVDGLAIFVGLNHSFAMSAAEFPDHLKPNSIYFTDDKELTPPTWDIDSIYGGHDIGIFDYEKRTISPCYYPCELQSIKRIMPAPMWFTPGPH